MFSKLRLRIVLLISVISAVILIVSLSATYLYIDCSVSSRDFISSDAPDFTPEINNIISGRVRAERDVSMISLARTLFFTGASVEIVVIVTAIIFSGYIVRPVEKAYESERQFIANASHELKTPIAAISANLEAADISGNPWIENVSFEAEKLARINKNLLALARLDNSKEKKEPESFSPRDYIIRSVNLERPRLKNKTIKISASKSEINLDRAAFTEIFDILLDNAIKYSDSQIEIKSKPTSLLVKNDGKQISDADLPKVFFRFFQCDKTSSGVGLGLSIAKSLADKNAWSLKAKCENGFTIFELTFKNCDIISS